MSVGSMSNRCRSEVLWYMGFPIVNIGIDATKPTKNVFHNQKLVLCYVIRIIYSRASHIIRSPLHWRHNDHDGVSNHQPHGCLLNRLFRRRSKKTSKLRVTGLCVGNSPGLVNFPHKGPVTRKCFHLMTSSCFGSVDTLIYYLNTRSINSL